jgi:hypothetical protein
MGKGEEALISAIRKGVAPRQHDRHQRGIWPLRGRDRRTGAPPKMPEKCLGSGDIARKIRRFGS